jgi:hypothetical protein
MIQTTCEASYPNNTTVVWEIRFSVRSMVVAD